MGYFLLFEGMLDSVLYARDKWLSPSGLMAPSRTDILISAMGDEDWYNDKLHFWNDVYGFSMNAMNTDIKKNGVIAVVPSTGMISDTVTIKVFFIHI
jgi:protein arginine N-methyltransferase 3